jgi:hypothetical protein
MFHQAKKRTDVNSKDVLSKTSKNLVQTNPTTNPVKKAMIGDLDIVLLYIRLQTKITTESLQVYEQVPRISNVHCFFYKIDHNVFTYK